MSLFAQVCVNEFIVCLVAGDLNGGLSMNTKTIALKQETVTLDSSRIIPAVAALMVGAFLVLAAGFAHSSTVHNAAHDARHAFAFPCH